MLCRCGAAEAVQGKTLPCRCRGLGDGNHVKANETTEYLRLWTRQHIFGSVEVQLRTLRDSLLEVIDAQALAQLQPQEVEELVAGVGWEVGELLPHVEVLIVREE